MDKEEEEEEEEEGALDIARQLMVEKAITPINPLCTISLSQVPNEKSTIFA